MKTGFLLLQYNCSTRVRRKWDAILLKDGQTELIENNLKQL
jgi:hypothetical protein